MFLLMVTMIGSDFVCLYPSSILVPIGERSIWRLLSSAARSRDMTAICEAERRSLPRPSRLPSEEVVGALRESRLLEQDMPPGLVPSMLAVGTLTTHSSLSLSLSLSRCR